MSINLQIGTGNFFNDIDNHVATAIRNQTSKGVDDKYKVSLHTSKNGKNKFVFIPEEHTKLDPESKFLFEIIVDDNYPDITYVLEISKQNEYVYEQKLYPSSNIQVSYIYINSKGQKDKIEYGDIRSHYEPLYTFKYYRTLSPIEIQNICDNIETGINIFQDFLQNLFYGNEKGMSIEIGKMARLAANTSEIIWGDNKHTGYSFFIPIINIMNNLKKKSGDSEYSTLLLYIHDVLVNIIKKLKTKLSSVVLYQAIHSALTKPVVGETRYLPLLHLISIVNDMSVLLTIFYNFYNYTGAGQIVVFVYGGSHVINLKAAIESLSKHKVEGFGY